MLPTFTVVVAGKAIPEIEMLFGLLLLAPAVVVDVLAFEQDKKAIDTAHATSNAKDFVFMI